jgi:hypothetical protein
MLDEQTEKLIEKWSPMLKDLKHNSDVVNCAYFLESIDLHHSIAGFDVMTAGVNTADTRRWVLPFARRIYGIFTERYPNMFNVCSSTTKRTYLTNKTIFKQPDVIKVRVNENIIESDKKISIDLIPNDIDDAELNAMCDMVVAPICHENKNAYATYLKGLTTVVGNKVDVDDPDEVKSNAILSLGMLTIIESNLTLHYGHGELIVDKL